MRKGQDGVVELIEVEGRGGEIQRRWWGTGFPLFRQGEIEIYPYSMVAYLMDEIVGLYWIFE